MTANVPAGSDPEISYLSGVTSSGVVAATSFWTYASHGAPQPMARRLRFLL
jgi:hypothetical protein